MKSLIAGCTFALLCSSATMAQMQDEKRRAAEPGAAALTTSNEGKHAREADARHCLGLKSEREIIRCAEPYRYRGARAR